MSAPDHRIVTASIIAVGIAIAGLLIGNGFARGRAQDRYVTVKGVTERQVQADLAIWPLHIIAADDDLARAHARLQASVTGVKQFLARNQLDTADVTLQGFSVSDAQTNQYGGNQRAGSRFVIHETILVRSTHPDVVLAASQRVGELVSAGVILSSGGEYGPAGGPTFIYSALNSIKPTMIAEATTRAREAAEQFAHDSKTQLAGIRQANQGVFEILPRNQAPGVQQESEIAKTVRVVATVQYFLGK